MYYITLSIIDNIDTDDIINNNKEYNIYIIGLYEYIDISKAVNDIHIKLINIYKNKNIVGWEFGVIPTMDDIKIWYSILSYLKYPLNSDMNISCIHKNYDFIDSEDYLLQRRLYRQSHNTNYT